MSTCAIYVRQSMDKAEGIDRQLARCRALAAARGWEVVAELEDNAVSAFKTRGKGTAWARLLESPADVVVSVNLDRLLRGQADLLSLIATGKTVATVEGDLDLTTAEGKFRAELLTSLATFESGRKGERQTRSNESRVSLGLPVPGKRRFGFEPGNRVERAEEAELVRWACDRILAGQSLRSVAKRFGKSPVRVREILTNPSYAGWVVRGGERFEAAPEVARVVDRVTWSAVQDLLADDARRTSPGPSRKHFLSGIARCADCGASMRVLSVYYKCSADNGHATIYRRDIEPHVKRHLLAALMEQGEREEVGAPAPLALRLRELEDERSRWTTVAAMPGADLARVASELARVQTEAESVSEQLGRSRVGTAHADLMRGAQEAAHTIVGMGAGTYTLDLTPWLEYFDGLDLDEQRALIETNLSITVGKGRGLDRVNIDPK